MKRWFILPLALLCLAVPAHAADTAKSVRLVYVEWDCATATTHLVKAALEDRGYTVEALPVSAAAMWLGVATGDADATLSAWLPATHADYYAKNKSKIVDLGPLVDGARLGWAVPDYVQITSIAELKDKGAMVGNQIIGIDPGSGLMRLSEKALEDYGLTNMRLMEGSGASMAAALGEAIRRQKPIVVTAWSPHWMFGRWKLRYLDDPKKSLGGSESIHTIARKGLDTDNPEVYAFLDKFHYESIDQLQTLMDWNSAKGADLMANARRFMKEHPALAASWFAQ